MQHCNPSGKEARAALKGFLVVYVDNHILVVFKRAGIATQSAPGRQDGLEEEAKRWIKKAFDKRGAVFLHPIHRLDKEVSGLVLFARSSKALSRLQQMLRERKISRTYLALVEGEPKEKEGELKHFLIHGSHRALLAASGAKGAKPSLLFYRILEKPGRESLLEVRLVTGRYHQIRAQLSAWGHPVVGDRKYGSKMPWQKGGIALVHAKLEFIHPVTKANLSFTVSWKEAFF